MGELRTEEGLGRRIGEARLCCGDVGCEKSGLSDGNEKLVETGLFVKSSLLSKWKCRSNSSFCITAWLDKKDSEMGGEGKSPNPMASKSPEIAPERR